MTCSCLWAPPSLLNQKGQVVYPIFFTYPARVDDMGQIVFGIGEKKEGDSPLGSVPEIIRSTGSVSENKSRFRQGRRDQAAPIRYYIALGMGRVAFRFLP